MSQSRVSPLLWGEMINDLGDRQWYITNHGQNKLKRPVLRAANAHHPNWQKLKSGLFRECSKPDGFFSKELIQVRAKHCWKKTNHFDDGSAAGGEEEHSRPCSTKRLNDFMLVFPPQSVQFKMWNILKKFCVCWNLGELCFIKESYKCDWGARDHPGATKALSVTLQGSWRPNWNSFWAAIFTTLNIFCLYCIDLLWHLLQLYNGALKSKPIHFPLAFNWSKMTNIWSFTILAMRTRRTVLVIKQLLGILYFHQTLIYILMQIQTYISWNRVNIKTKDILTVI